VLTSLNPNIAIFPANQQDASVETNKALSWFEPSHPKKIYQQFKIFHMKW